MSVVVTMIVCDCGKLHATAGSGPTSTCTCGRLIQPMIWDLKHLPGLR